MKRKLLFTAVMMLSFVGLASCGETSSVISSTDTSSSTSEPDSSISSSTSSDISSSSSMDDSSSSSAEEITWPSDATRIADIASIPAGENVVTYGYYVGSSNALYDGYYNGAYIADGANYMQLYKIEESLLTGVSQNDLIKVTGTTAHYTAEGSTVTVYELDITEVEVITDEDFATLVEAPVITTLSDGYTLLPSDINKKFYIEGALVTNVSANNYGNLTITFTLDGAEYTLYLDSRYSDVTIDELANLKAGDTFTTYSYVGSNRDEMQFVYYEDFTVTKAELPSDITPLSELTTLSEGETFTSVGYYMGNCGTVYNGTYNAVFVGDGTSGFLLYRVSQDLITSDFVEGETVIKFTGTYSPYSGLPEAKDFSTFEIVTDPSIIAAIEKPEVVTLTDDYSLVETDINRKFYIEDATVDTVSVDDNDTYTINFSKGANSYVLRVDNRYNNPDELAKLESLEAGDTFSTYTYLSTYNGNYQFTYISDFEEARESVTINFDDAFNTGFTTISTEQWEKTVGDMKITVNRNDASGAIALDQETGETLRYIPLRIYSGHSITFELLSGQFTDIEFVSEDGREVNPDRVSTENTAVTIIENGITSSEPLTTLTLLANGQFRLTSMTYYLA